MHPRQEIDGIHCVTSHLPQIKLIADKVPGLKSCSLYNVYIYIYTFEFPSDLSRADLP